MRKLLCTLSLACAVTASLAQTAPSALALPALVAFDLGPFALNHALCKLLQKLDNPLSKLSILQSTRLSMSKKQPIPPHHLDVLLTHRVRF